MARNGRGDGGWGLAAFAILGAICPDIGTPSQRLARALVKAQLAVPDAAAREEAALLHAQEAVARRGGRSTDSRRRLGARARCGRRWTGRC